MIKIPAVKSRDVHRDKKNMCDGPFSRKFLAAFFSYFIQRRSFYSQLTLPQQIQSNLESWFVVRSRLGPSIQSGSSDCARLQVVKQLTQLLNECYPETVIEQTAFQNSALKLGGLQLYVTTASKISLPFFAKKLLHRYLIGF